MLVVLSGQYASDSTQTSSTSHVVHGLNKDGEATKIIKNGSPGGVKARPWASNYVRRIAQLRRFCEGWIDAECFLKVGDRSLPGMRGELPHVWSKPLSAPGHVIYAWVHHCMSAKRGYD